MDDIERRNAIDRFLADNPELEQLKARLATFNVFRALGIDRVEIRHSNTLAWLLDPAESHGLGDIFLRRLLSNMLLVTDANMTGLSAAKVELMDLGDVEVRREWHHTDVLVVIRSKPNVVLLIENKVGSGEGKGQLVRYRKDVGREFPSFVLVPVFLTLQALASEYEEASDFIRYGHAQVHEVLDRIVSQRRAQLPEAVATFLDQYLATLRRMTMTDQNLVDLCKEIYRKNKEAIELIMELGKTSAFSRIASEFLEESGAFEILSTGQGDIWFLPKAWRQLVPENGQKWSFLARRVSVVCWMSQWPENKVKVIFEVCAMNDPKLRLELVNCLQAAGFRLGNKAFKEDASYSRFFRYATLLSDPDDEDEMREAAKSLIEKAREQFPKVEKVLKDLFGGKVSS